MSFIGYARVSTSEGKQLLDRQVDALTEVGCERILKTKHQAVIPNVKDWMIVSTICEKVMYWLCWIWIG